MIRQKSLLHILAALALFVASPVSACPDDWMGMGPGRMDPGMAGGKPGMHSDMMQRMMGNALPPGMDPALLPDPNSAGARLYQGVCTQCHYLPDPRLHTAAEWPSVLARMNMRMRMMHGMMGMGAPSGVDLQTVLAYLQEHAYQPIDSAKYPDLETKAGRVFSTVCAQCHALPDPRQHGAQEWPAVVARMRHNMTVMGKMVPDDATIREVLDFLQRNSSAKADIRSAQ